MPYFKAANHVHSTNSDGAHLLHSVIEEHYKKQFDVLSITEHNTPGMQGLTRDWINTRNGLSKERFSEITAGVGRKGKRMLWVPLTNEQSVHDHICSYNTDYDNRHVNDGGTANWLWASTLTTLQEIQNRNGVCHMNHPGRYTGGQFDIFYSNDPVQVAKYVFVFMTYSACVGMEIINKKDGESRYDRYLWDNVNSQTIPHGRFVWGFSNDDTHNNQDTGYSFNMLDMTENTLGEFERCLRQGHFYAVAKLSWDEQVISWDLGIPTPVIHEVIRQGTRFHIVCDNVDRVYWVTDGTKRFAEGNMIDLVNFAADVATSTFVRAYVVGPGGVAFTQPMGI